MNKLVEDYAIDVDFPDVSGIENVWMLRNRSRIHQLTNLSEEDKLALASADAKLYRNAAAFLPELSHFIDLCVERQDKDISPGEWWWYLDVLAAANQATMGKESAESLSTPELELVAAD